MITSDVLEAAMKKIHRWRPGEYQLTHIFKNGECVQVVLQTRFDNKQFVLRLTNWKNLNDPNDIADLFIAKLEEALTGTPLQGKLL